MSNAFRRTRDILFTPDGKRLLLTIASGSNAALDMFPGRLSLVGPTVGIRLIRSAPPGTAKKAAPIFCLLILTARMKKSMPREFEIPRVLPYSPIKAPDQQRKKPAGIRVSQGEADESYRGRFSPERGLEQVSIRSLPCDVVAPDDHSGTKEYSDKNFEPSGKRRKGDAPKRSSCSRRNCLAKKFHRSAYDHGVGIDSRSQIRWERFS
jgi:hypothetical protein